MADNKDLNFKVSEKFRKTFNLKKTSLGISGKSLLQLNYACFEIIEPMLTDAPEMQHAELKTLYTERDAFAQGNQSMNGAQPTNTATGSLADIIAEALRAGPPGFEREIASALGYEKPNMVRMFARGHVKVPLEKLPALARVLEKEPMALFGAALQQFASEDPEWNAFVESLPTELEYMVLRRLRLLPRLKR